MMLHRGGTHVGRPFIPFEPGRHRLRTYTPIFSVITSHEKIMQALDAIAAYADESVWATIAQEDKEAIRKDVNGLLSSECPDIVKRANEVLALFEPEE